MQGLHEKHSNANTAGGAYIEFIFSDGVMIDCSYVDSSWNLPLVCTDNLSATARKTEAGTIDCELAAWSHRSKGRCQEENKPENIGLLNSSEMMPKIIVFPKRKPCMSDLGIHMCDCEDDSMYCNLVTCMASSSDRKTSQVKGASLGKMVPDVVCTKDSDCRNCQISCEQKPGGSYCVRTKEWTAGSELDRRNGQTPGSNFGNKSAIAAWAAVVSDTPYYSMPTTGLVEAASPKKGSRNISCKEKGPTFASHLELTESLVVQSKLSDDHGEDASNSLAYQSVPWQASSLNWSTIKRQFAGLKLDTGNLSINDPAPYGTLHGVLHCTLTDGLPNYTFLLDDYEEVLTAKTWLEDTRLGQYQEIWKYHFYSLREERKRKGKSGWRNWRRKDKLNATSVGRMRVSSVLCSEEEQNLSVKSECILFGSRLDESAVGEEVNGSTQVHLPSIETETNDCVDAKCMVCVLPVMSSPSAAATSWQSSSPMKLGGPRMAHKSWHRTQICHFNPTTQRTTLDADRQDLSDCLFSSNKHQYSELAAMIINVPLQMQDRRVMIKKQHPEASITVILPSGNHGRPLRDLEGPSPLINRWKEGGRCDCKGWDLGCGLMVLSFGGESLELQRQKGDVQRRSLRLYKQDVGKEEAFFSLAPQANGLIAIEFRAPLSALQAFAIAVATLHGRASSLIERACAVCTNSLGKTFAKRFCGQSEDEDELSVESADWKEPQLKSAINSKLKQALQPQVANDKSFVKMHTFDSDPSFERV